MDIGDEVFVKGKILGVDYSTNDDGLEETTYRVALYNINDETDNERIVICKPGECFRRVTAKDGCSNL